MTNFPNPLPPGVSLRPGRGRIPTCVPWFGPHPSDPSQPPHGLARLSAWTLDRVEHNDGPQGGEHRLQALIRVDATPA